MHAVVFAGSLGVLAWRRGRRDLVAVALVLIALAGASRVVGGAHLASDVVAGWLLGVGWLVFLEGAGGARPLVGLR